MRFIDVFCRKGVLEGIAGGEGGGLKIKLCREIKMRGKGILAADFLRSTVEFDSGVNLCIMIYMLTPEEKARVYQTDKLKVLTPDRSAELIPLTVDGRTRVVGKTRSRPEMAFDRHHVAKMYLEGHALGDIARSLGLTNGMVSNDLQVVQKWWQESAVEAFQKFKGRQLARIDNLERTYWDAFRASTDDNVTTTQYIEKSATEVQGAGQAARATVTKQSSKVSLAALAGIQWCITERSRMLGLYKAVEFEQEIREQYMEVTDIFLETVLDAVNDVYGEEPEKIESGEKNNAVDTEAGEIESGDDYAK